VNNKLFQQNSVQQSVVRWQAANRMVLAAISKAESMNVKVNVAVVDTAGVLVSFLRMSGAPLHSIDIAIDKAYTSVSFGVSTSKWKDLLAQNSSAVQVGIVNQPRFIGFGGGEPIFENDQLIGAIGVSGASESEDEAIAKHGLKNL
jgi:uncharacterized protein GlcG (DUF336 family)